MNMRFLHLAVAGLAASAISAPALGQASAVAKAKLARSAGRSLEAEAQLSAALKADQNNYPALYNMGMVYMGRGDNAPSGPAKLRYYRTAASWLERALNAPGRQSAGEEGYAIFNSLGATYLGLGDLQKADFYLQQGLRNEARLSAASRGRLYGNLGYLYALQGDAKRARIYLAKGASLGNAFAKENMRRLDTARIR